MEIDPRDVHRRAWRRLGSILAILFVLLFLPAWTWTFWEAWVYWLLFFAMSTGATLYFLKTNPGLIARRLRRGPTAEGLKSQRIIQLVASVLLVVIFVVASLDHRFGWSFVPTLAILLGDAGVVLGLLLSYWVLAENSYASSVVEVQAGQTVVSTGPYRWVRHPMYLGTMIMLLFTPIALGSFYGLLPAAAVCLVIVWRLVDEERFLRQHLGGYDAYCAQTRYRLVPFAW